MKMISRTGALVLFLSILLGYGRADDRPVDTITGASGVIEVGAAPIFLVSPADFCERDSDVSMCVAGMGAVGFQLEGRYRFPFPWFALGLVGGAGFELDGSEECSSDSGCTPVDKIALWRVAAEVRLYPLTRRHVELWFALEGGVVGAAGAAIRDAAGEGGLGFGMDFPIGRYILIGFDIRTLFLGFGQRHDMLPDNGKVQMTNTGWASFTPFKLGVRF